MTLTLDRVILHTPHRPLPTYQISLKSIKLSVKGRTYGCTFETQFIRSARRSRLKIQKKNSAHILHLLLLDANETDWHECYFTVRYTLEDSM